MHTLLQASYILTRFGSGHHHNEDQQTPLLEGVYLVKHKLLYFASLFKTEWGTRRCSWLRHCATNLKVMVRFPMVPLEFFIDIILVVAPCLALRLSHQPLTEMSTRNISWEVKEVGE
jgi:hypothetical protein